MRIFIEHEGKVYEQINRKSLSWDCDKYCMFSEKNSPDYLCEELHEKFPEFCSNSRSKGVHHFKEVIHESTED